MMMTTFLMGLLLATTVLQYKTTVATALELVGGGLLNYDCDDYDDDCILTVGNKYGRDAES